MDPLTSDRRNSVAALGEEKLIQAIRRWLGRVSPRSPFGIGDDCAVLRPSRRPQLVTVDPVIFGRHFDATVPARAVGAKLLKRNVSDIAAMGGRPRAAVVALTLDARTRVDWVEGFYRGLAATARKYRISIIGGDVAQANGVIAASLTLIGEASGPRVLARQGARRGDWIYVTGRLGNSLATGHHFRFEPRLREGAWLAKQPAVRSMMDVSDGLAKDLHALTPAGCAPALDAAAVPCRAGANLRGALSDGEDYELVFTLAQNTNRAAFQRKWQRQFPKLPLSCIGRLVDSDAFPEGALNLDEFRGYEHLR